MKKFLFNSGTFIIISFLVIIISVVLTGFLVKTDFNYYLPNKRILILGDSHTLCGLDDAIIPYSVNLSESADTYFYSYLKLREIADRNNNLKTLILGFAEHNISESQDQWLTDSSINNKKLSFYYFLFDWKDILEFTKINPTAILKNAVRIIKGNVGHLYRIFRKTPITEFGIGTHLKLNKEVPADALMKPNKNIKIKENNLSKLDLVYLQKINQYCVKNKIKLILINTPVLVKEEKLDQKYMQIYNKKLPTAELLDFSNIMKDKKYFSDVSHLNNEGAIQFSNFLKTQLERGIIAK